MDDYQFFKYRPINKYLLDSLAKGTLHFSHPDSLNDPFDCQVDIRKSAELAIRQLEGEKRGILETISRTPRYFDEIQSRMAKVGVCSFSLTLQEPTLWSHYADAHRGVCLLYQFPEEFLVDPRNNIVGVTDIVYGDNPLSTWFREQVPEDVSEEFYGEFTTELLKRVLMVKGAGWKHENEVRILREVDGPFEVPRECLKQVCFGLRTSDDDIQLIREIVGRFGYTVTYGQMRKTQDDFGIEGVDVE